MFTWSCSVHLFTKMFTLIFQEPSLITIYMLLFLHSMGYLRYV